MRERLPSARCRYGNVYRSQAGSPICRGIAGLGQRKLAPLGLDVEGQRTLAVDPDASGTWLIVVLPAR